MELDEHWRLGWACWLLTWIFGFMIPEHSYRCTSNNASDIMTRMFTIMS
jgi:hypothetical protein